jgi:hypothetical protein
MERWPGRFAPEQAQTFGGGGGRCLSGGADGTNASRAQRQNDRALRRRLPFSALGDIGSRSTRKKLLWMRPAPRRPDICPLLGRLAKKPHAPRRKDNAREPSSGLPSVRREVSATGRGGPTRSQQGQVAQVRRGMVETRQRSRTTSWRRQRPCFELF